MPGISIIVPVYNVEPYIHRCIDSILNQTFTNFELILVDDGSPDNCGKICDEYARKDNRVHVIHQENSGLSAARNAGIDWAFRNSDSEWLTFIDSDDWVHSKYLELLYNAIVETQCGISICGYEEIDGKCTNMNYEELKANTVSTEDFFCKFNVNATVAWGKLYKKTDFENIRYPVGKLHEDEFTTYRILFSHSNLAVIDQPLYYYYKNSSGIMNSAWSPKRLCSIEALNKQVCFFKSKGYEKAYMFSIWHLTENIICHYKSISDSQTDDYSKKYLPAVKKELRRTLKLCKNYSIYPSYKYETYYRLAFPYRSKLYNFLERAKAKIKRT